jgi:hypothetical protein
MTVEEMRKLVALIAEHLNIHDQFAEGTPAYGVDDDEEGDDANARLYVVYENDDDEYDLAITIELL